MNNFSVDVASCVKSFYRHSQHSKWSKLHYFPEEKDAGISSQEEKSSDEDADLELEMDNNDDVRIDDVLHELVNKSQVYPENFNTSLQK
jgi:hypothetical protein